MATGFPPCVRSAWLVLGSVTVQLESAAGGWFCQQLDLGYPAPREVVANNPDRDGVVDRTQYMGARVVSANITALAGAGARVDDVADNFAPFMVPSARPVLHYVLDRAGVAERTLTLRASGYSWPIVGANQRDIQLQWVAADPVARDPNTQTVTAWPGASSAQGRTYPLTFNRTYPAGGAGPAAGTISSPGDVAVRPLLRIYGPITGAQVTILPVLGGQGDANYRVWLLGGYIIDAGHWVDIDTAARTAYRDSDHTQPVLNQIDWVNTAWPALRPNPQTWQLTMTGSNTTSASQVQAIFNDGYLT